VKKLLAIYLLPVFIVSGFLLIISNSASAVVASEWKAGRIIDDAKFTGLDMSVTDIQNFLNNKVPNCDTWGTQPASEYGRGDITHAQYAASRGWPGPPYVCLKNYHEVAKNTPSPGIPQSSYNNGGNPPAGSISAAQMIFNAAQQYRISPKVLLVKLGTESAGPLTDDRWPLSSQYNYAMGAHCPDSGPGGSANCDSNYAGFSIQIAEAAGLLRWYLDSMTQPWWQYKKPYATNNILWNVEPSGCGGGNVYIESMGTAALYTYTPYQPNQAALNNMYGTGDSCSAYGNRNFWRVYNDWFGSTSITNLVRTPSDQTYYLLTNGKRFAIPNGDMLYAYGLERQQLSIISDQALQAIPNGGMLQTTFTVPGDGTVFLADLSNKYGIASGDYCIKWGLNCSTPSQIGTEISTKLTNGGVLQPIMNNAGSYYLMEDGYKKQFLSIKAMIDRGYVPTSSTIIGNWTNAIRTFGFSLPEDGSFVKFGSSNAIFAYNQGNFYSISSYEQFRNWYSPNTPSHFDPTSKYNTQPPALIGALSDIVYMTNGSKYLIDGGRRIDLTNVPSDWPAGIQGEQFSIFLNRLPINATATTATSYRQPNGGIYKVLAQTKQPFNSIRDYYDLGYGNNQAIQLSANINMPIGNTVFAEGSAYKIQGSDAIFRVGLNGRSSPFQNLRQIWDFKTNPNIPTISATNASQFSVDTSIKSLIKSSQGQIFIVNELGKIPMSSNDINNWGINTGVAIELGNISLGRIQTLSTVPVFLSSPNGTIFKGENGSKKPIANFDAYKRLGGNASNTAAATLDVLDTMPTGTIIQ
jgi:hypothetical protein